MGSEPDRSAVADLSELGGGPYSTLLADPPWRFDSRSGKISPEYRWLLRYETMTVEEIAALPVPDLMEDNAHCYLWVPNALLPQGLEVMEAWGFRYKAMLVWAKRRRDGGPDGRGVGFYFRNTTETILFGVRGKLRTLNPGRRQVNIIETMRREHSRKPDELYPLIEACSPPPFLELFARYPREGWTSWGNEAGDTVVPRGKQYRNFRDHALPEVRSLAPLLDAGLIVPGERLLLRKRGGTTFFAHVNASGELLDELGNRYSSPTQAAMTIAGYKSVDGWLRWRTARDGVTLATLRDQLSSGNARRPIHTEPDTLQQLLPLDAPTQVTEQE